MQVPLKWGLEVRLKWGCLEASQVWVEKRKWQQHSRCSIFKCPHQRANQTYGHDNRCRKRVSLSPKPPPRPHGGAGICSEVGAGHLVDPRGQLYNSQDTQQARQEVALIASPFPAVGAEPAAAGETEAIWFECIIGTGLRSFLLGQGAHMRNCRK